MVRMGLPQLIFDPTSLNRSSMGTRTGVIYFDFDTGCFPSRNWSDLAPDFSYAWLHALIRLESKESTEETVFFMDGPYVVELARLDLDRVEVCFFEDRPKAKTEHGRISVSSLCLLQNAISVQELVQQRCHEKGWEVNPAKVSADLTEARKLLWKLKEKTGPPE